MHKKQKERRVIFSGIFIVVALLSNYLNVNPVIGNSLMIAAAIIAGYPIAKNAIQEIRYKVFGIDVLVTVAVIGAIFIQEYWEAAAVTFLFMLGSYLESRSLEKTRSSIQSLFDKAPKKATVLRNGMEMEVDPSEVQRGETVIIKPGEKIPVDGSVLKGKASVNQAAITGESIPVEKNGEDQVFSGTVIETGSLQVKAEKVGEDTTFSRILEMVEEAQDSKAPTQKFLERFSKYYTPSILIFAIVLYLITMDIELALTLLVISCPGALVISAPVSIVSGIGNAAKQGILFKGGEYVEKMAKVNAIVFDKTGTLTIGKPVVTNIKSYGINEQQLLKLSARAEMHSEHHLAKAVVEEAKKKIKEPLTSAEEFESLAGHGVRAEVDGEEIFIGTRSLMKKHQILIPEEMEEYLVSEEKKGQTAVLVTNHEKVLGVISIADQVRPHTKDMIQKIKKSGIQKTIMLTGDNPRTAATVTEETGVDEYRADLLPEDKVTAIKELQEQGYTVAMIGDGINDAPALATADVGVAMGAAGTDVAMETADLVLMSDQIEKLPYSIGISKATITNMKQNITFAVVVVMSLLIGVLTKTVFLASGMLIHEVSVLIVIINAIRLLKYRVKEKEIQSYSKVIRQHVEE
ncbi:cation-translocating P-type ATPase [Bacillaceae bacterium S4-13-56]